MGHLFYVIIACFHKKACKCRNDSGLYYGVDAVYLEFDIVQNGKGIQSGDDQLANQQGDEIAMNTAGGYQEYD